MRAEREETMAKLLIVYGTREGHTRAVARRIADFARERGHAADVVTAELDPKPGPYDAVVVAAPVHRLRHPPEVTRWVIEHLGALRRVPTAFFSVSLAAALPTPDRSEDARRNIEELLRETGWRPAMARPVAGALAYTRYGFLTRLGMRLTARMHRLDTDTSRDHVYTDWEALRRDAGGFLAHAFPAEAAFRPTFAGEGI